MKFLSGIRIKAKIIKGHSFYPYSNKIYNIYQPYVLVIR